MSSRLGWLWHVLRCSGKDIHCSPHDHSPAGARLLGDVISSEYEREDEQSDAIILSRKGHPQQPLTGGMVLGLGGSGTWLAVGKGTPTSAQE